LLLVNEENRLKKESPVKDRPHVIILGAGASVAAFPNGDRHGRMLPLMNNLPDVLVLRELLEESGLKVNVTDFEALYSDLAEASKYDKMRTRIEQRVQEYFKSLKIPPAPTIYDFLLLSLREKDLIASFNWDPLLFQACRRNYKKFKLPPIVYLHGNVAIGHCPDDKVIGAFSEICRKCGRTYRPIPLLYPTKKKEYDKNPYIDWAWRGLRIYLQKAYMVTIFGYSAPTADVAAITLMKDAWRSVNSRNLEQIEIIDIKEEVVLHNAWKDFIHSHHYQTCKSFRDSWIARHPRRTCEAMWDQTMELEFLDDNPIPNGLDFPELWRWFEQIEGQG
jgi:DICT domain-containing protein